ncbi:hypothetical protein QTP88_020854 [Uroleucon formosanum]
MLVVCVFMILFISWYGRVEIDVDEIEVIASFASVSAFSLPGMPVNASFMAWVSAVKILASGSSLKHFEVRHVHRISLKIAVIVVCEVLFFWKWRSCVLILGDHCQKGDVVNGYKVSVLIRQFELLHSLVYVSMIFSRFIGVLGLGEEVNICDAMWCSRFFFFLLILGFPCFYESVEEARLLCKEYWELDLYGKLL